MSKVLIIFQSNTEPLEQMALAVAVGAVEAGGSIRLRRLAAPGAPEVGHQSYGKIQMADLEWANSIVVGLEHKGPMEDELGPLLKLLHTSEFTQKRAWTFTESEAGGLTAAQMGVEDALRGAGISVGGQVYADSDMKALGRRSV